MKKEHLTVLLRKIIPSLIIASLIAVSLIWFIPSQFFPISWDFRNNLWGPANLLINQESPYNIHVIFQSSNAVWMPVIIGLLFPIGYLPIQWASNLWLLLNLISLCLIVFLIARNSHLSMIWVLLTIFSLAIFPATMTHFALGQISLIICLLLFILGKYPKQLNPILIGLILAISFTKPQLVVLFLPAYLVRYSREKPKQLFLVCLYTVMWTGLLCLPLFLFFPNWVPDLFFNLADNTSWIYPTLYSFLISCSVSVGISLASAGIFLIIGIATAIHLTFKLDHFESLIWSLALTPLFSPVVWSWDLTLIYPLIVFMFFQKKSRTSSWILFFGYGFCTIIFIFMKILGLLEDQMTFWIPPFLIATFISSRAFQGKVLHQPDRIENE